MNSKIHNVINCILIFLGVCFYTYSLNEQKRIDAAREKDQKQIAYLEKYIKDKEITRDKIGDSIVRTADKWREEQRKLREEYFAERRELIDRYY